MSTTVIMPSEVFCFVCHRKGDSNDLMTTFVDLFNSKFDTSQLLLSDTLSTILGRQLTPETVHSRCACEACLTLCTEFDELVLRINAIKLHLIQSYNDTIEHYCPESNYAVDILQDDSNMFPTYLDYDGPIGEVRVIKIEELDLMKNEVDPAHDVRSGKLQRTNSPRPSSVPKTRAATKHLIMKTNSKEELKKVLKQNLKDLKEEQIVENKPVSDRVVDDQTEDYMKKDVAIDEDWCFLNDSSDTDEVKPDSTKPTNNGVEWPCKFCSKPFESQKLRKAHEGTHTEDRPYKCTECPKDFAVKYTLNSHLKTHADRKRDYPCPKCAKSFYTHHCLVQHERIHSGLKEFICKVCGKAFGTQRNLESHQVVHNDFKPFLCKICGKSFAREFEVRQHEGAHAGEKPYKCDLCGALFAQRSNLSTHKRMTHLNDKRYTCAVCGRSFKRRRLLEYHTNANHTGKRPHACKQCPSAFVNPDHLRKHVKRLHTAAKPYQCEVCGKAFNSCDNRNAHRYIHSDKKPYECMTCGQGFMRKPRLLEHIRSAQHQDTHIMLNLVRVMSATKAGAKPEIESNVVPVGEVEMIADRPIAEHQPDGTVLKTEPNITEDDIIKQILVTAEGVTFSLK